MASATSAAAAAEYDSVTSCMFASMSAPSQVDYKSTTLMQVLVQVKAKGPPSEEDSSIAAQLMRLQDPKTGKLLADKYLLPQISVLFWAGFDTTGNTMAWTLFCISQHPEVGSQLPTLPTVFDCPAFGITFKPLFSRIPISPPLPDPLLHTPDPFLPPPFPPPLQPLRKNCCTTLRCSVAYTHILC